MALDIDQEIAAQQMVKDVEHQEMFDEPTRSAHDEHLIRRIARRFHVEDLTQRAGCRAIKPARDLLFRVPQGRHPSAFQRTGPPEDSSLVRDPRLPGSDLYSSAAGEDGSAGMLSMSMLSTGKRGSEGIWAFQELSESQQTP